MTSLLGGGLDFAGAGFEIAGAIEGMNAANAAYGVEQQMTGTEIQMNNLRQQAMTLDAQRKQIQVIRNTQLAKARGEAAAVNQGGTVQGNTASSGYAGGQAQATGAGAFNLLGINQDLSIGNQIFGLQNTLSQQQLQLAGYQTAENNAKGLMSIGQGIAGFGSVFS